MTAMAGDPVDGDASDPQAVFRLCPRSLSGHGPRSPQDELRDLAESTGGDERWDYYGSGTVIEDFERHVADLLGKPAAVFVPSGTMAQQIALRIWSNRHGCRTIAFHPTCHLDTYEQMGYQRLHGLHGLRVGDANALITLEDLEQIAEPVAALLLELPQRRIGGQLPEWEELCAQTAWARERGIALHMDGARLWESGPFYERSYQEIATLFDSVYVSFYKGIGGMAGAALAGPNDLIAEARIWIRRHGGNLIHLLPYIVSARSNLQRRLHRFAGYHRRAIAIAQVLHQIPGIAIRPQPPHTNMAHVYLHGDREQLMQASRTIAHEHGVALFSGLVRTEVPDHWGFEVVVGDAAEQLADGDLDRWFRQIMATSEQ